MPAQYTNGQNPKANHFLRAASINSINLRSEKARLRTFQDWPIEHLNPKQLAKSGFYYKKIEEELRCAFCGLQMKNWSLDMDEDPTHYHKKTFGRM